MIVRRQEVIAASRHRAGDVQGILGPQAAVNKLACLRQDVGRFLNIDDGLSLPPRDGFGPFTPGFITVPFGDATALEALFVSDPTIVGFLVEPVQGEAGVIVPPTGSLRR